MNTCPPVTKESIERGLQAEFDSWFARLQALSTENLTQEDWTQRWYDGYTPADALLAGPEGDDD